jgi:hypothetical protein
MKIKFACHAEPVEASLTIVFDKLRLTSKHENEI